jgi:hypothetical protein
VQTPRKKHPIEAQIESSEDELPPLYDDDSSDEGENEMSDVDETPSSPNFCDPSVLITSFIFHLLTSFLHFYLLF